MSFVYFRPSWLARDVVCLFAARALRSIAQGYLAIILPIYLADLGYRETAMGLLFAIAALTSAVMAALTGILADRWGPKPFLIGIALLMAAGSLVLAMTRNFAVMVTAASLGTIGFSGGAGLGGGWGPYYPAAQSLVAEQTAHNERTAVFGMLSFVGVLAGALGSLVALLPELMHQRIGMTMIDGFRALFVLTAILGLSMAVVVIPVREIRYEKLRRGARDGAAHDAMNPARQPTIATRLGLSGGSWRLVSRFMITNATNGLAIGMLGPFVVYWFYRRYGASVGDLARLYFAINLLAALPYLLAARLTARLGAVNTVVITRSIASVLLLVMVTMPTFWLAAAVYTIRAITNVLSIPVRQSYLMGVIAPAERASAAGLANLPSQATQSLSAYFAGYIMEYVALTMPLILAGGLQALNALLYYVFFRHVRPPEEIGATVAVAAGD
jgi:MFS family permease